MHLLSVYYHSSYTAKRYKARKKSLWRIGHKDFFKIEQNNYFLLHPIMIAPHTQTITAAPIPASDITSTGVLSGFVMAGSASEDCNTAVGDVVAVVASLTFTVGCVDSVASDHGIGYGTDDMIAAVESERNFSLLIADIRRQFSVDSEHRIDYGNDNGLLLFVIRHRF